MWIGYGFDPTWKQWRIQNFPGGANLLFGQNGPENCMKMKFIEENWARRGQASEPLLSYVDCSGMGKCTVWQSSLTRKSCGIFAVSLVMPLSPNLTPQII